MICGPINAKKSVTRSLPLGPAFANQAAIGERLLPLCWGVAKR
jgi:hypothetical protein